MLPLFLCKSTLDTTLDTLQQCCFGLYVFVGLAETAYGWFTIKENCLVK